MTEPNTTKAGARTQDEQVIIIVLDGGVIQEIANIPAGMSVVVRDFDTEGADEADLTLTPNGEKAFVSVYRNDGVRLR